MSVHPSKTPGKFDVRYDDPVTGKQRSKTLRNKTEANRFDRSIKSAKDQGALPDLDKAKITVGAFFERVFVPKKQVSKGTKALWGRLWGCVDPANDQNYHLRAKWANVQLRDANNKERVLDWLDEIEDNASPSRIFQAHGLLVNIITFAVELDYLTKSNVSGIQVDYEPKETGEPWLPADIEAVRADILRRGASPPRGHGGAKRAEYLRRRTGDALAVSIMGYMGLRIAECFALQWPMLMERDGNGRWQVRQHVTITSRISHHGDPENRTKTTRTRRTPRSQRRPRIIEVDPTLRKEIRDWWMACGQPTTGYALTTDEGQPFKKSTMTNWNRNIWSKSLANVGLPPEPPKHLRLSCVSMWLREGWDEGSAAAAAGHGTAVMWRTYHKALTARMSAKTPFDMSAAIATARADVGTNLRSSFGMAVGAAG